MPKMFSVLLKFMYNCETSLATFSTVESAKSYGGSERMMSDTVAFASANVAGGGDAVATGQIRKEFPETWIWKSDVVG